MGRNVTQFQPGDVVFGDLPRWGFGAFAEYVVASAEALALKPTNLTFEQVRPNQKDLMLMKELIEAGKVTAVIDRSYPLCEVPDAIRYLETGHAQGKVVITVEHNH